MPKTPGKTRKLSPFFLIPFTFFLTLLLSLPWVNAKEAPKPKPQPWQIDGIVAALDDSQDKVKKYAFDQLVQYKPQDLKSVVKKPEDIALQAVNILKDEKVDSGVRSGAAEALGNLGEAANPYVKDILDFLKNEKVNSDVGYGAAVALGKIRKLQLNEVVVVLDRIYEPNQQDVNFEQWRFLTYFLSGGTEEVKTLLQWVGYPKQLPTQLKYEEGKKTLEVFRDTWTASQELERLQNDLAEKIAEVAHKVSWKPQDIPLLQTHYENLLKGKYNQADTVQSAINDVAL